MAKKRVHEIAKARGLTSKEVLAALNAVVNLGFIAAYPIWVVLVISLDVIVIYALIVHGREAKVMRQ